MPFSCFNTFLAHCVYASNGYAYINISSQSDISSKHTHSSDVQIQIFADPFKTQLYLYVCLSDYIICVNTAAVLLSINNANNRNMHKCKYHTRTLAHSHTYGLHKQSALPYHIAKHWIVFVHIHTHTHGIALFCSLRHSVDIKWHLIWHQRGISDLLLHSYRNLRAHMDTLIPQNDGCMCTYSYALHMQIRFVRRICIIFYIVFVVVIVVVSWLFSWPTAERVTVRCLSMPAWD